MSTHSTFGSLSSYVQAIDGINGCPLHETLVEEETRLGPRVSSFLWTMAVRDLNLSLSPPTDSSEGDNAFPWQTDPSELNPLVFSDYQKLARHYNSLIDEYEEMERSRHSLDMKEWDSKHSTDALVRIKRAASDRLLDEIENVKLTLYRARVERRNERSLQSSDNAI